MKHVLLILIMTIGCGADHDKELPPANVAELNLYPHLNPENMIIGFGDVPPNASGVCVEQSGMPSFIRISETFWNNSDIWTKKVLILHELGHCVYHKPHDNRLDQDGMPISIMNQSFKPYQVDYFQENEVFFMRQISE